jgi:ADP-ribosylglycohydrolase
MFFTSKNKISIEQMTLIDDALDSGASPSAINFVSNLYEKKKISAYDFETYIKNSIYVIVPNYLINKYRVKIELEKNRAHSDLQSALYGTIYGDIAGSLYEFMLPTCERNDLTVENCIKEGSTFSDDTVLACKTALVLTENNGPILKIQQEKELVTGCFHVSSTYPFEINKFARAYREGVLENPGVGYGPACYEWALYNGKTPYGSYGNGSAMRISPVGEYFDNQDDVILHAAASAAVTHNHPEGVKGSIVTAMCVWMAKNGHSKDQILNYAKAHYQNSKYRFTDFTMKELFDIKADQNYLVSCMYSVPASIICFYHSDSFEDVINNVLSFYGDTDTLGAIAGGIAGAYYGVPERIINVVKSHCAEEWFQPIFSYS